MVSQAWRVGRSSSSILNARPPNCLLPPTLRQSSAAPFSSPPSPHPHHQTPHQHTQEPRHNKTWRWSALLLFAPGAATLGLAGWQVQRYYAKVEMLEHRRSRIAGEAIPLGRALQMLQPQHDDKDAALSSLEFRRVALEGIYEESKSMFVGPRARSNYGITEKGYFLVTPLLPSPNNGDSLQLPVLVNRGWVPSSWRDNPSKIKSEETVPFESKVSSRGILSFLWRTEEEKEKDAKAKLKIAKAVGVIRNSENPNMFVPANVPDCGQWFYVDVPAMACAARLPENTIYVEAVEENASRERVNDFPVAKDVDALLRSPVMPNDHLSYAATWLFLSIATTFMAFKRLTDKRLTRI